MLAPVRRDPTSDLGSALRRFAQRSSLCFPQHGQRNTSVCHFQSFTGSFPMRVRYSCERTAPSAVLARSQPRFRRPDAGRGQAGQLHRAPSDRVKQPIESHPRRSGRAGYIDRSLAPQRDPRASSRTIRARPRARRACRLRACAPGTFSLPCALRPTRPVGPPRACMLRRALEPGLGRLAGSASLVQ